MNSRVEQQRGGEKVATLITTWSDWAIEHYYTAGISDAAKAIASWIRGAIGRLIGKAGGKTYGAVGIALVILTIGYLRITGSDGWFFYRIIQICRAIINVILPYFFRVLEFSYRILVQVYNLIRKICYWVLNWFYCILILCLRFLNFLFWISFNFYFIITDYLVRFWSRSQFFRIHIVCLLIVRCALILLSVTHEFMVVYCVTVVIISLLTPFIFRCWELIPLLMRTVNVYTLHLCLLIVLHNLIGYEAASTVALFSPYCYAVLFAYIIVTLWAMILVFKLIYNSCKLFYEFLVDTFKIT